MVGRRNTFERVTEPVFVSDDVSVSHLISLILYDADLGLGSEPLSETSSSVSLRRRTWAVL
jgi:hypothetical protein